MSAPKSLCGTEETCGNNFQFIVIYIYMGLLQFVQDQF